MPRKKKLNYTEHSRKTVDLDVLIRNINVSLMNFASYIYRLSVKYSMSSICINCKLKMNISESKCRRLMIVGYVHHVHNIDISDIVSVGVENLYKALYAETFDKYYVKQVIYIMKRFGHNNESREKICKIRKKRRELTEIFRKRKIFDARFAEELSQI